MSDLKLNDLILPGIVIAAGWLIWQTIGANWGSPCPLGILDPACLAKEAGKATGGGVSYVYNYLTEGYTGTTAILEDPLVASQREAEHSYIVNAGACDPTDYSGGPNACTKFGSSSGQSPEQFCADSPTSPICADVVVPWWMTAPVIGWFL
jgi:hypothetical protein